MPGRLLAEWMAYSELEPFGPPADFTRAGIVASQIFNVNRAKKSDPVARPQDYLPSAMVQEAPQDDDTLGERNASILKQISEDRRG